MQSREATQRLVSDDTLVAVDRFLGDCIRQTLRGEPIPEWPFGSDKARLAYGFSPTDEAAFEALVAARTDFHGIGLTLVASPGKLADWPAVPAEALRAASRNQSFWELGHRDVAARLIDTLTAAGAEVLVTKGTALAYSVYKTPAERRRGDSDLLVRGLPRSTVRKLMKANGFRPVADARPFQETWCATCPMGFLHMFDIHWRINASAAVAERLERGGIGSRSIALPRLAQSARGIAPTDNLILIAVNRALHRKYGYQAGEDKAFDQERLIWALDVSLLTRGFTEADWTQLLATVGESGTAPLVRALLDFGRSAIGMAIPDEVTEGLAQLEGDPVVLACTADVPGFSRTRLDLAASDTLADKLRVIGYALVPNADALHERYPHLSHWPTALLHARRISGAVSGLLLGRS